MTSLHHAMQAAAAFLCLPNAILLFGAAYSFTKIADPFDQKLPNAPDSNVAMVRAFALSVLAADAVVLGYYGITG